MRVGELRELLARLDDDLLVVCVWRDESTEEDCQADVLRVRRRNCAEPHIRPHIACEIMIDGSVDDGDDDGD